MNPDTPQPPPLCTHPGCVRSRKIFKWVFAPALVVPILIIRGRELLVDHLNPEAMRNDSFNTALLVVAMLVAIPSWLVGILSRPPKHRWLMWHS